MLEACLRHDGMTVEKGGTAVAHSQRHRAEERDPRQLPGALLVPESLRLYSHSQYSGSCAESE
jgi:hypothetical protein